MLATLNILVAVLGLVRRLFGVLLLPVVAAFFGPWFRPGGALGAFGPLLLHTGLPWLLAALPLALVASRRGLNPAARRRPGERTYVVGHVLIGLANVALLVGLVVTVRFMATTPTAPVVPAALVLLHGFPSDLCWLAGLFLVWRARDVTAAHAPSAAPDEPARASPAGTSHAAIGARTRGAGHTPRWLAIARAVSLLNGVAAVLAVPLVIALMAYGLVHASDAAGAQLLGMLLVAFAVLAGLPLALFAPMRWAASAVLHGLGALALLLSLGTLTTLAWPLVVEPAWMSFRFKETVRPLTVVKLEQEPVLLDGVPAGVRMTMLVRLPRAVTMDAYGRSVLDLLRSPGLGHATADPVLGAAPFSYMQPRAEVWLGDARIDDMRRFSVGGPPRLPEPTVLAAGTYRVTRVQWLWGLNGEDAAQAPCLEDMALGANALAALRQRHAFRLVGRAGTRFALNLRNGYRDHLLESEPFDFSYDHDAWVAARAALPLEACVTRRAREHDEQIERQAAAGDPQLKWQDNPLATALCADDLAAARERLSRGVPKYDVAEMMAGCRVGPDRPGMFDLMMSVLYARESERRSYCRLLEPWLRLRQPAPLERLHALGLPVMCATVQNFRALLNVTYSDPPAPGTVLVPWMTQLEHLGADLCEASVSDNNLLQHAIGAYDADVVAWLLDRHCDPALLPTLDNSEGDDKVWMSARMKWRLRTFAAQRTDVGHALTAPIDATAWERLQARIGEVSPQEFTRVDARGLRSVIILVGEPAFGDPRVLAWLAAHGARLDASGEDGYGWYAPGYTNFHFISAPPQVLDVLSDDQLRQVMHPVNVVTGRAGRAFDRMSDRGPGTLGSYLCQRKAIPC